MENLNENKGLLVSLGLSSALVFALATGFLPGMAYQFEVVEFPADVSRHKSFIMPLCARKGSTEVIFFTL
jgi:hypothetical protein